MEMDKNLNWINNLYNYLNIMLTIDNNIINYLI